MMQMQLGNDTTATPAAACPLHDAEPVAAVTAPAPERLPLEQHDELVFPRHRRMFAQYRTTETDVRELCLYYGDNEISFDEPELFAFGEGLAQHARFLARDTLAWGGGYDWSRIRALLEELVATGVLLRAGDAAPEIFDAHTLGRSSLVPSASSPIPRTWHDAAAITREMTGRAVDVGYLELLIPPYRIAHPVLDAEGRQVGEANVYPKTLRLDVPTEWRVCPHAGSRYHDPLPMNVTALKSMRVHWKPMMVALLASRTTYLQRFPQARAGWTVGDLHCLSAFVLSIPAYLTMRARDRIDNGQLDPVLAAMYRVTDGVRMVMHNMLFSANVEPTRPMDAPITTAELLAYAERNRIFHGDYGVCAGPPALIDEFLRVLVDGEQLADVASIALPTQVTSALADLEPALDYVLLGLEAYAVWSSRWPPMVRVYEDVFGILESWHAPRTAAFHAYRERVGQSVKFLRNATRHNTEDRREKRERVYAEMFARSERALGRHDSASLADCIAAVPMANEREIRTHLRHALQRRLCGADPCHSSAVERLGDALMDYVRHEQAIVRNGARVQARINELLGRAPPAHALTGADLAAEQRILGSIYEPEVLAYVKGRLPHLLEELDEELGIRVEVAGLRVVIADSTSDRN